VLVKNSLPARERELIILRTGFRCHSKYEFHQHTRVARASGVSVEEIERTKRDVATWSGTDAVLMRATDELIIDKCIGDNTWAELKTQLTETQLFDLIFTVGQYTLVSMALNTLGIQIEEQS
jgi:4-carboxymuconolactone decarboxylase